jgi:hypothetical protein
VYSRHITIHKTIISIVTLGGIFNNVLDSIFLIAQADAAAATPQAASWLMNFMGWVYLLGDPAITTKGLLGSLLTWLKIIGLFSLVAWIGARVLQAIKDRISLPALSGLAAARADKHFFTTLVAVQAVVINVAFAVCTNHGRYLKSSLVIICIILPTSTPFLCSTDMRIA